MDKLNIVFVHVDQMHHKAVSAYGCEYVHTPNMDRLPPLPDNFDYDYKRTSNRATRNWSLQDWRYYIYSYYRMTEMKDIDNSCFCSYVLLYWVESKSGLSMCAGNGET